MSARRPVLRENAFFFTQDTDSLILGLAMGAYTCGWCGVKVARKLVYQGSQYSKGVSGVAKPMMSLHTQEIYECAHCEMLTYNVPTDDDAPQLPTPDPEPLLADRLPPEVEAVWNEVLACRRIAAPLATAGILRSLIIAIWREQNDKADDDGWMPSFEEALKGLEKSEALTPRLRQRAGKLRDLGSDALHKVKPPSAEQLDAATSTAHLWLRVMYEDVPED